MLFQLLNQSEKLLDRDELVDTLASIHRLSVREQSDFGLILFSIDRFKLINGRFGHTNADIVLRRVANSALQFMRRHGVVGRWGGDEFLCILPGTDVANCYQLADELRQRIVNLVIPVGSSVTTVTCSFGVACYPDNGSDLKSLMMGVDEALYEAKHSGRNRVRQAGGLENTVFRIGGLVESAIREDRIMPAYQPIFELENFRVVGEEALARIISTDEKVLEAHEFIDAAYQLELTHKIDRAIVASALHRCVSYLAQGKKQIVFANISSNLLRHPDLIQELLHLIKSHGRNGEKNAAESLVIEITERELFDDPNNAKRLLTPFLDLGLRLALDDFGSGYSSFHYLADLPISFLKIDGRLIQRLQESRIRAIVRGIQNTASDLGLITLAEYVERERQANILRELGVHWAQGHYFRRAKFDEEEAQSRRQMSVNWAQGYYYRRP
jgi:diguanylate cyclase (GGDEF)-like protein